MTRISRSIFSLLALSIIVVFATTVGAQEGRPATPWGGATVRDQIPPPPPPPAWPGVAAPTAPNAARSPALVGGAQPPAPLPRATWPRAIAPARPAPRAAGAALDARCPATPDCGLRRDACCWPLDACGKRYGRFTLRLEGTLGGLGSPSGPFGGIDSGLPNQMDWSVLDDSKDPLDAVRGRITLGYAFSPTTRLVARGGWYGSWESSATSSGVFAFFPGPAGMGGVSAANTATLNASADLYSGELTLWNEIACTGPWRFDWGLGLGALRFDEKASARDWGATFPGFMAPAYVQSDVENTYIAGQLGLQVHYAASDKLELSLQLLGRIGAMENKGRVEDRAFFAPGAHQRDDDQTTLAFGGLLEFGLRWRLTSSIALTTGYNLMLTDGVVRAYDAMDFRQSDSGAVGVALRKDTLVNHTLFLGFELGL